MCHRNCHNVCDIRIGRYIGLRYSGICYSTLRGSAETPGEDSAMGLSAEWVAGRPWRADAVGPQPVEAVVARASRSRVDYPESRPNGHGKRNVVCRRNSSGRLLAPLSGEW